MENTQTSSQQSLNGKITQLLNRYPIIMQLCRFAAIGIVNTALDFIVLNFITKHFGVEKGTGLSIANAPGFILAVIQSYFWNKYWAFGENENLSLFKNFLRLVWVGILGVLALLMVFIGAKVQAAPNFYLMIFIVFLIAQLALWSGFGFFRKIKTFLYTRHNNPK